MSEKKVKKLLFEMDNDFAVGFIMDYSPQIIVDHADGVDAEEYFDQSAIGCGNQKTVGCDLSITGVDVVAEDDLFAPYIETVTPGDHSLIINYISPPVALNKPSNLQFTAASSTDWTLEWDAVTDADYYDVYVDTGSGFSKDNSSNVTGTSYVITTGSVPKAYIIAYQTTPYQGVSPSSDQIDAINSGISLNTILSSESFESDFGNWVNDPDNSVTDDWSRNSGSTPSSSTGPSSAQDGSWYVYVETSSNSGSEEAILELDPFNGVGIDFQYHQYGVAQGTLYLEGYDGSSWIEIWSTTGDQGDQWNYQEIITGTYQKIRFRNVHDAGGSFEGDISLDLIRIKEF